MSLAIGPLQPSGIDLGPVQVVIPVLGRLTGNAQLGAAQLGLIQLGNGGHVPVGGGGGVTILLLLEDDNMSACFDAQFDGGFNS